MINMLLHVPIEWEGDTYLPLFGLYLANGSSFNCSLLEYSDYSPPPQDIS